MTPESVFPLEAGEVALDASSYTYRCNGDLTAIVEPWCRHRAADGALITRALRTDNANFVMAVKHRHLGDTQALALRWQLLPDGPTVEADYRLKHGVLSWTRSECERVEQAVGGAVLLFPLMRVFTGAVVLGLEAQGGAGEVLVPSIKTPDQPDTLFKPLLSRRRAVREPSCDDALRCYRYEGDQYEQGTLFWLDDKGLLQRYTWQQDAEHDWEVALEPQSREISTT